MATAGLSVAAAPAVSSPSPPNGRSYSDDGQGIPHKGHNSLCGDTGAYKVLSEISGISMGDLMERYPQKTAWQVAKQIGKLDPLKKAFLEKQKIFINRLIAEGKINTDDAAKIYADLQKRVAKIDGVGTVTLGKPGYRPQIKNKK
jgi:hypothetical protein